MLARRKPIAACAVLACSAVAAFGAGGSAAAGGAAGAQTITGIVEPVAGVIVDAEAGTVSGTGNTPLRITRARNGGVTTITVVPAPDSRRN